MAISTTSSHELRAFVATCRAVGPRALAACPGWTAHDVAAHVAATAAEVVRHLEPYRAGRPVPGTRSFAEREVPFRALAFDDLLQQLVAEVAAMDDAVGRVLARELDAAVPWTGRSMAVATFPTHLRSELALHRWDLVGDDAAGDGLLADPTLTDHAVEVLGAVLPRAGASRDPGGDVVVGLRSEGAEDVVVEVHGDEAVLRRPVAGEAVRPGLHLDAAARLLVLWGRRPDAPSRVLSALDGPDLARLQGLLAGY